MMKGGRAYLALRTTVWRPGRGPAGKLVAHLCSVDLWRKAAVTMGHRPDIPFDGSIAAAAVDYRSDTFTPTERRRLARAARRYDTGAAVP